jgi:hypothetical protein
MGFFKHIGKSINHSKIGKKMAAPQHILGKKASSLSKIGKKFSSVARQIGDDLSDVDNVAQKIKGSAILAGPYAPVVMAGIEGLHGVAQGYSAGRSAVNSLAANYR